MIAFVRDPDGYRIELIGRVPSDLALPPPDAERVDPERR